MKKTIITLLGIIAFGSIWLPTFAVSTWYLEALDLSTSWLDNTPVQTTYDWAEEGGRSAVTKVIISVLTKILLPLMIFFGIAQAMFGFYSIMTSTSDDAKKKGMNYIIWGVVGIILISSASFLAYTLYGWAGWWWIFRDNNWLTLSWPEIASNLYSKMIFPFVRFLMYFIMGLLFVIALVRAINLLLSNKDEWAKQAGAILKRNAFGLLVIIFSKALIEAVYGKEEEVVNLYATTLSSIWWGVDKNVPFVFTIINYLMWFIGIFLLVMIIIQAVQILTKPTDEAMQKKLRKNIIYILIWLVVMWLSYVITNVFIVR